MAEAECPGCCAKCGGTSRKSKGGTGTCTGGGCRGTGHHYKCDKPGARG